MKSVWLCTLSSVLVVVCKKQAGAEAKFAGVTRPALPTGISDLFAAALVLARRKGASSHTAIFQYKGYHEH